GCSSRSPPSGASRESPAVIFLSQIACQPDSTKFYLYFNEINMRKARRGVQHAGLRENFRATCTKLTTLTLQADAPREETMQEEAAAKGRILLVDDESAILRTFRYCLEDDGYVVATAGSAAQADNLLLRQVFDLCFLDLRLGEDNGLDLLAQMRIQAPWMRVVIVTAHSAVDTAVDAIQAGAADYLVKPCSPDQLRLAAAKQLEVRALAARLEALEGEVR